MISGPGDHAGATVPSCDDDRMVPRRGLSLALTAVAVAAAVTMGDPTRSMADDTSCEGRAATVVGTDGDDDLVGTPQRDVIVGLGGDDRLEGLQGRDVICGGDGADTILGGPRRDHITGGSGDDHIEPEEGDDVVLWRMGDGRDVVVARGLDDDLIQVWATDGDDVVTLARTRTDGRTLPTLVAPDGGGVVLSRGRRAGIDVWMGAGADRLVVPAAQSRGVGTVRMYAGPRTDQGGSADDGEADVVVWRGTDQPDSVNLSSYLARSSLWAWTASAQGATGATASLVSAEPADRLQVDGLAGRDKAFYRTAYGPNDVRATQPGADRLLLHDEFRDPDTGSPVLDQLLLGFERLTVVDKYESDVVDLSGVVSTLPVRVFGGQGFDTLVGSPGHNRLIGGRGRDLVRGGGGADQLVGATGPDRLYGGRGDDLLDGGSGPDESDECTGGPGDDAFSECEVENP